MHTINKTKYIWKVAKLLLNLKELINIIRTVLFTRLASYLRHKSLLIVLFAYKMLLSVPAKKK